MEADKAIVGGLGTPRILLDVGITGHRSHHPIFSTNRTAIAATLADLIQTIEVTARKSVPATSAGDAVPVRLHSLLAYGSDMMAVGMATARQWPVVAPLPFGRQLNLAINAQPATLGDMERLLADQLPATPDVAQRAAEILSGAEQVSAFELAEQDAAVEALYRAHLADPENIAAQQAFYALCSDRAAMAARVMIEHSDVLIGIWDGETRGAIGGTRHTIETALELGVPVVWIDARNPSGWRVLRAAEELAGIAGKSAQTRDQAGLHSVIVEALQPSGDGWGKVYAHERWRPRSSGLFQAYRRIELLFGEPWQRPLRSLSQRYEPPTAIEEGSAAPLLETARNLPGGDPLLAARIGASVLRPFAWADGVATWLADAYRGSMVLSFFLSAFAIVGGIAYLPVATVDVKWGFALFEFALLAAIIGIFMLGKRLRWHQRWFAMRRVAEYFRHAPVLLILGAARSTGRWPRGSDGNWPEWYVRHALRAIGLPQMRVTASFLRAALELMRDCHVEPQRAYHLGKAGRLHRAQHNLDRLSEWLFIAAVCSVAVYLLIEVGAATGWWAQSLPEAVAKSFTFIGVLLPTLGGAFAGVHYFGDFERFAGISEVTAEKLGDVAARIAILLEAPDADISYAGVSALAHAIDEIVVDEIENWQSVFGGKHITVPV
jgi:hypothetical protein